METKVAEGEQTLEEKFEVLRKKKRFEFFFNTLFSFLVNWKGFEFKLKAIEKKNVKEYLEAIRVVEREKVED